MDSQTPARRLVAEVNSRLAAGGIRQRLSVEWFLVGETDAVAMAEVVVVPTLRAFLKVRGRDEYRETPLPDIWAGALDRLGLLASQLGANGPKRTLFTVTAR